MDSYYDTGGVDLELGDFEVSVEELASKDGRLYLTGYDYKTSQHFIAAVDGSKDVSTSGLRKVAEDAGFLQEVVTGTRVSLSSEQFGGGLNDGLIDYCDSSLG